MKNKNLRLERKRQRYEENKTFILKAAENVFIQKGYNIATVDDIADEAQFSKATIYRYFKSKKDIFMEIIINSFEEASKNIKKIQLKTMNAEEKLKELIGYIASYYLKKKNVARILYMERSTMKKILGLDPEKYSPHSPHHPQIPGELREKVIEMHNVIQKIIEEGIKSGEFRKIDAKDAAFVFGSMLRGFFFRGPIHDKEYSLSASTRLLHDFFLYGIKKV